MAVEQGGIDQTQQGRQPHQGPMAERREDIAQIVGEADRPGRDVERPVQQGLPQEEKGEHVAQAPFAEQTAQIGIGSARMRHGGAQFGPDEAVAQRNEGAQHPADQGLGAAHGGNGQGNGDERTDSDHVEDVGRQAAPQADGPFGCRGQGRIREWRRGRHAGCLLFEWPCGTNIPKRVNAERALRDELHSE
jgi:hypothetical protein